jgi:hypothetical protein
MARLKLITDENIVTRPEKKALRAWFVIIPYENPGGLWGMQIIHSVPL